NAKQSGGVGSGHLNYLNHFTGAHLDCTVTAVTTLTGTTAEFSGTCSPNSSSGSFQAHVEDHAEPGKGADKVIITYGTPALGQGVFIARDGSAAGQFQAVLLGTSLLGAPQDVVVEGQVGSGSVAGDGSTTFSGTATVNMGDGTLPLPGVPFTVTASPGSLAL